MNRHVDGELIPARAHDDLAAVSLAYVYEYRLAAWGLRDIMHGVHLTLPDYASGVVLDTYNFLSYVHDFYFNLVPI